MNFILKHCLACIIEYCQCSLTEAIPLASNTGYKAPPFFSTSILFHRVFVLFLCFDLCHLCLLKNFLHKIRAEMTKDIVFIIKRTLTE